MKANNLYSTILNTVIAAMQSVCAMYVSRNFKQQQIYVQKSTFNYFKK